MSQDLAYIQRKVIKYREVIVSINILITIIGTLMVLGYLIDYFLSEIKKTQISTWATDSWLRLDEIQIKKFVRRVSLSFLRFFDIIYGGKIFSFKRLSRSFLSTIFALTVIALLVGPENTKLAEIDFFNPDEILSLFVTVFCLNLVVDFFSLTETRLVLGWAAIRKIPISILILFDLFLTTALF